MIKLHWGERYSECVRGIKWACYNWKCAPATTPVAAGKNPPSHSVVLLQSLWLGCSAVLEVIPCSLKICSPSGLGGVPLLSAGWEELGWSPRPVLVGCGHSRGCPLPPAQHFAPLPNLPLAPRFARLNWINPKVWHPVTPVPPLTDEGKEVSTEATQSFPDRQVRAGGGHGAGGFCVSLLWLQRASLGSWD